MNITENQEYLTENTSKLTDKEILAQNIVFFRKKMGFSQTELAKELKYSNKNISKWENAETTPDIFTIKKLAKIFNVSVDTLVNPITNENKDAIKTKLAVPFRWKVYMLLLINSLVIFAACTVLFVLKSANYTKFPLGFIFVYMLPIIDLSVFIFICCTKKRVDIISLSLFGWLIILACFISFINTPNIFYIFFLGLAYQFFAIVFAKLINSGKIIKFNKLIIKRLKK